MIVQETEEVSNEDSEVAEEAASDKNEIAPTAVAEQAVATGLECSICEINVKTERCLNSHIRKRVTRRFLVSLD